MAQPVDVGSVLGGRYKVTSRVLVSGEQDVVLDGVDQVLNRPVSILVAGPDNGDHLTQGAREVATGERHANLQILDLGSSEGTTYLIANQSPAADLLDLVVPGDPYVEPFFTDTLGQEIFGMPRPEAPDNYRQYDYVYEDDSPVEREADIEPAAPPARNVPSRPAAGSRPAAPRPQSPVAPALPVAPIPPAPAAPTAPATSLPAAPPEPPSIIPTTAVPSAEYIPTSFPESTPARAPGTAPQPARDQPARNRQAPGQPSAPRPAAESGEPAAAKVTLWSADDYGTADSEGSRNGTGEPTSVVAAGAAAGAAGSDRRASSFPASARQASAGFDEDVTDYEDDEENAPRTGGRWLVGGVVAVLLVAALIFAVTTIGGGLFGNKPVAATTAGHSQSASAEQSAAGSSAAQSPAAPVVAPVIGSVSRLVPGAPDMGKAYDSKLPATFDGNPGTFWQTLEFSNDNFAGLTSSVNLVVQLKQVSDIKSVTLTQLGGSGGSFKLLTNSQPSLDGAKDIGTGSFTAPDITLPAPQGTKAQYVIISFTQLPKQQSFQTYPYAAKIAEISIK
ncbi:MAG: ABC transporter substrate-binding protein [Actinomycetota bacterium]|nr:ABC transporter substrate-binding protein [Actinomycetota bacterium]